MRKEFWNHSLATEGVIGEGETELLDNVMSVAQQTGAVGVEIPAAPIMNLTPEQVAESAIKYGIAKLAMCWLYPTEGEAGDPLAAEGSGELKAALETLEQRITFAQRVNDAGKGKVRVTDFDGPWMFRLAYDYPGLAAADKFRRMVHFGREAAIRLRGKGFRGAHVETLQFSESPDVLCSTSRGLQVVRAVNEQPLVDWHYDGHHADRNGEDRLAVIRAAGKDIGWTHLHGWQRSEAGSTDDRTDWSQEAQLLDSVACDLPVVPEPFGVKLCEQIPPLKDGVIVVQNPVDYYKRTKQHFLETGILNA